MPLVPCRPSAKVGATSAISTTGAMAPNVRWLHRPGRQLAVIRTAGQPARRSERGAVQPATSIATGMVEIAQGANGSLRPSAIIAGAPRIIPVVVALAAIFTFAALVRSDRPPCHPRLATNRTGAPTPVVPRWYSAAGAVAPANAISRSMGQSAPYRSSTDPVIATPRLSPSDARCVAIRRCAVLDGATPAHGITKSTTARPDRATCGTKTPLAPASDVGCYYAYRRKRDAATVAAAIISRKNRKNNHDKSCDCDR
jgi:hypothetical protein